MAAADPPPLCEQEILEQSCQNSLQEVTELVLRGRGLRCFASEWAPQLPRMEVLSLSHNALPNLSGFSHFSTLVALNVSSNALTSLEGLQGCQGLERLYMSCNKLRDVQPLAGLTRLATLSCMNNQLSSLELCVQVGLMAVDYSACV